MQNHATGRYGALWPSSAASQGYASYLHIFELQFLPSQPESSLEVLQGATANPLSNSRWEFPRDRLDLQVILGSGAFGIVMRAQAAGIKGCVGSLKVAVKIVKGM